MINVNFDKLIIDQKYDRPYLAEIWGYNGIQGLSRGVITPASDKSIVILFVTKEKQASITQYNDYIDGSLLHWEGESEHGSDQKIIDSKVNGIRIHLFYRDIHHTLFTYYGEIILKDYLLKTEEPSEFTFIIPFLSEPKTL